MSRHANTTYVRSIGPVEVVPNIVDTLLANGCIQPMHLYMVIGQLRTNRGGEGLFGGTFEAFALGGLPFAARTAFFPPDIAGFLAAQLTYVGVLGDTPDPAGEHFDLAVVVMAVPDAGQAGFKFATRVHHFSHVEPIASVSTIT